MIRGDVCSPPNVTGLRNSVPMFLLMSTMAWWLSTRHCDGAGGRQLLQHEGFRQRSHLWYKILPLDGTFKCQCYVFECFEIEIVRERGRQKQFENKHTPTHMHCYYTFAYAYICLYIYYSNPYCSRAVLLEGCVRICEMFLIRRKALHLPTAHPHTPFSPGIVAAEWVMH